MSPRKVTSDRASALRALDQRLSTGERVVLSDELDRATANTLRAVAQHLSPDQLSKALEAANNIENEAIRVDALSALAKYLIPSQLEKTLDAARQIGDEQFKARVLRNLAPYLSVKQLKKALHIAEAIGNESALADALSALAQYLAPGQLGEALKTAAEKIRDESVLVRTLGVLAQTLSGNERTEALDAALKCAMKNAMEIKNERIRADALGELAEYLSSEQLNHALKEVDKIGNEPVKARVRGILASKLLGDEQTQRLEEALKAAMNIECESIRVDALVELAHYLTPRLRDKGLKAATEIENESAFAHALCAFARYLSPEQVTEALERANKMADKSARADALSALAQGQRTVSVMMPFGGDDPYLKRYYKLHYNRIKENFRCVDVKRNGYRIRYIVEPFYTAVHSIPLEGLKKVVKTDILVSLVSHRNINVIYETGVREVVKGGVIRLVEGVPDRELPVYLSHQGYIPYETPEKTEVGKAIEAMARMDFSGFILSDLEEPVLTPLRMLVETKDENLREQLESALQEIEDAPPGDAPEILNLFKEVPPSRIVATWDAYFPYSVVRIKWKRMSGDEIYTDSDLEDEPVICAANRAFLNLFDIARTGGIPDPDGSKPLTQTALAERLVKEQYVNQSTFETFLEEQNGLLNRLIFHCETDWATEPLRLDGENHHPYYSKAQFLPCVIAKWTIGERANRHEEYYLIAYVRLDHNSKESLKR